MIVLYFLRKCSIVNNKQLYYAIELSKTLNFSQVSQKLGISQPALSKQIMSLEKELGVILFERRKNPMELTAAGEFFFDEAKALLYREQQLYRSMEKFNMEKMGNLVIGISPFRSLYILPDVCKKVKEKYNEVKIILREEARSEDVRRNAAEGKYDFAIANLPVDESALDVIPIEQDILVLAVHKKMIDLMGCHEYKEMQEVDFRSCSELPFVVVGKTQEMRQLFEKNCVASNMRPNIAMEVVGLSTAWAMVHAGIGATLLPLQYVKKMNNDDSVAIFIPKCHTNVRQPAIIVKHGQYMPEYAKYAISLLSGKTEISDNDNMS